MPSEPKTIYDMALEKARQCIEIANEPVVWLDAATGAGNATVKLGKLLQGKGKVISVDLDPISWTDWALPKVKSEGLLETVEFRQGDLRHLSTFVDKADGIFCALTISAMGIGGIDAISQWKKVLKKGCTVIIHDYLPQKKARNPGEEIANQAWRLYKACEVLQGEAHYEEIHPRLPGSKIGRSGISY